MPPVNEPSILQLVYDSVKDIRQTTADIANEQVAQGKRLERVMADMNTVSHRLDAQSDRHDKVDDRIDRLEEKIGEMRRITWLMTIVGGIATVIIASVASDFIGNIIDNHPRTPQHQTSAQPRE